MILTEKWTTDNILTTNIEIKDQIARGLKVNLDTHYVPQTDKRSAVLKTEWAGDLLKVNIFYLSRLMKALNTNFLFN